MVASTELGSGPRHRPIAGDSAVAEHVKVVARAHQLMIWSRQRQSNTLRSMLPECYPGALAAFDDLAGRDALALARTPAGRGAGHEPPAPGGGEVGLGGYQQPRAGVERAELAGPLLEHVVGHHDRPGPRPSPR
jgi:hypothetical protein